MARHVASRGVSANLDQAWAVGFAAKSRVRGLQGVSLVARIQRGTF